MSTQRTPDKVWLPLYGPAMYSALNPPIVAITLTDTGR